MSIEKPTIEEHNKLVQAALIEDGDYTDISNIIENKTSLEDQTLDFIKNILSEKYNEEILLAEIKEIEAKGHIVVFFCPMINLIMYAHNLA